MVHLKIIIHPKNSDQKKKKCTFTYKTKPCCNPITLPAHKTYINHHVWRKRRRAFWRVSRRICTIVLVLLARLQFPSCNFVCGAHVRIQRCIQPRIMHRLTALDFDNDEDTITSSRDRSAPPNCCFQRQFVVNYC